MPALKNALPTWNMGDTMGMDPTAMAQMAVVQNAQDAADQQAMQRHVAEPNGLSHSMQQQGPLDPTFGKLPAKMQVQGVNPPPQANVGADMSGLQFLSAPPPRATTVNVAAKDVPLTNPKNLADKQAVNQEAQANIEDQKANTTEAGQNSAALADLSARGTAELANVRAQQVVQDQNDAKRAVDLSKEWDKKLTASSSAMAKSRPQNYDEWYGSQSTADQVRYFISGILGGFLQGFDHRADNPALTQLNKRFEAEVGRERDEYERSKDSNSDLRNSYAEAMRQFGNEKDASRAALIDKYNALQQQMDATATAFGAPEYMQNARAANSVLDAHKIQIRDQAVDNNIRLNHYVPQHQVTVGGAAQPKNTNSLIFESPDGKRYTAANRMSRNSMAEQSGAVSEVKTLAQKLDALRNSASTYVPGTQENADAKVVGAQLQNAIREAGNMGVFKESDLPMFEMMLGDPTGLTSRSGRKSLDVANMMFQKFNDRLKAEAAEEVGHDYAIDPKSGQVVPVNPYAMSSPSQREAMPTAQSASSAGFTPAGGGSGDKPDTEDIEAAEDRK